MSTLGFWTLLGSLLGVGLILNLAIAPPLLKYYYHLAARPRQWWNHTATVLILMVVAIGVGVCALFGQISLLLLVPILWLGPLLIIIDRGCLLLPNRLTLPFGALSLGVILFAGALTQDHSKTIYAILISVMVFILTLPMGYVRIGVGGGDLKLIPALVALTVASSWTALLFFIFFTALGAGLCALWLLIRYRVQARKQFALGPWLVFGAYLAFLV